MSIFSKDNPLLIDKEKLEAATRKARIKEDQESRVQREIHEETEEFYRQAMIGVAKPSPDLEVVTRGLARSMVLTLRGFKGRIEQLGGTVTQMSAIAHQAWDATQVTIDASVKQSLRAYQAAKALKDSLAQQGDSKLRHVASSIDPNEFGFANALAANDHFKESTQRLVAKARADAAAGQAVTGESQAQEVLNHLMKEHGDSIRELPSMKDILAPRLVKK